MDNKVSVISIIVKDEESAGRVNELLHEFRQYIVGRMGIPYRDRGVSIISVVLDAPGNITLPWPCTWTQTKRMLLPETATQPV